MRGERMPDSFNAVRKKKIRKRGVESIMQAKESKVGVIRGGRIRKKLSLRELA